MVREKASPEADLAVLRRALADLANNPCVTEEGIVTSEDIAFGAVALIERDGPEIVLVRKAPRTGYEFSGKWALPGGVARSDRRGQTLTLAELQEALEESLVARARVEAGWQGTASDLQLLPGTQPRMTTYTRRGERKRTLVIPFMAACPRDFSPTSSDPSVTEARWWLVATTAEILAPANGLIVAEYYGAGSWATELTL